MPKSQTNNIFNAFPLPSLLLSSDSSFTIQDVNVAYQNEINISAHDILGKCIFDHFAENLTEPENVVYLRQSLLQVLSTKQSQKMIVPKTEQKHWEIENIPVFDENNEINNIIHTMKNVTITDKSEAEKERDLLKNNTQEPYVILDNKLLITSFNQEFVKQSKEYFGLDVAEGMSILDIAQPERREAVAEKYKSVLRGNKVQIKVELPKKDGSIIKIYTTDTPIFNEQGEVTGVFVSVLDITDLAELDKKQKEQEADLKALIENTPDLIYSLDLDFNLITFNSSFANIMQALAAVKVARGMNVFNLFGERKREKYYKILEIVKQGQRYLFEDTFIFNNEIIYFEVAVNPILNEMGMLIGVTIFSKNITEQKKLKRKEEEQRAEFKALVDNMLDVVYSLDLDLNLITFNKAMVQASMYLIGRPPQKGMNLIEYFSFGKGDFLRSNINKASEGKSVSFIYEQEINGELQIFEVYVNPIFRDDNIQTGFSVLSKTATEKVMAERIKEKTIHTLSNIMSLSLDIICTTDNKGFFTNINPASYKVFGYHPEELIGRPCTDFVYPEDVAITDEIGERAMRGEDVSGFENRYVHKNGKILNILWSVSWDSNEELLYCTAKDITEKKAIENVLLESFNRYKYLFENNPAPMYIWDFETLQIVDCNLEALHKYGYEREEFLQLTIKDIRPVEDIPLILAITQSEESYGGINREIWRHKKKNGEIMFVEVIGHLMDLGGRRVSLVQIKDVTEQENTLRELKDHEAKLRTATIIAKLGYWQLDVKKQTLYISEEVYNVLEASSESCNAPYETFLNTIHIDDKHLYINAEKAALNEEVEIDIEFRIVLKNGITKWIHDKGKAVKDEAGNIIFLEGTVQDITDQKKAQIALQERNFFIETAFQNLPIGIAVNKIDDGTRTLMNKKFEEIYGWPNEILTDVPTFFEKVYPDENYRAEISRRIITDIKSGDLSRMNWEGINITTQTGENRVVSASNIPIYAQNLMISSVVDDTERIKTRNNLIQSNERYNLVTKATSDAIWDWDLVNNTLFRGGGFKSIFGYEENGFSSSIDSWSVYLHPEDVDRVINGIQTVINSEATNWKDEYRYQKADGQYAYVFDKGFVQRNSEGKAIRMVGAMQDITERNEREQQLKLLESVILSTKDSVLITEAEPFDEPGPKILYVNDAFTKMTGYTAEEVIGKTPRILQGPKSDKKELEKLSKSLRKWEPCEVTLLNYKKNGEEFWINFSVTPVANEKGWFTHWIAIERDITEKVNHEQKLLEANRKIVNTLESIQDGFYALDKNWVVTYWNKEAEYLLKVKREDIIGKNLWQTFSELIPLKFYSEYHRAVEEHVPVRFEENLILLERWFEMSAFPSEDGLTVYFKDITERRQNEQQIKAEKNLLRTLIDNLPDTIYYKDRDARKLISNKVDYLLLGAKTEEEVLGKTDLELFSNNPDHVGYIHDIELLKTGKPIINYEEFLINQEGKPIWLLTSKMPTFDDKGEITGLLGIGRDISERKIADEKLKHLNSELEKYVQQLLISNAELEQFAYVASHDLQEPLRMITSFLTQIERKYKDIIDEKGKQYIYFAVDGAKRMRQIILDLLDFSRVGRAEDKLEIVDLNELVDEIFILHRKQIKEKKAVIKVSPLPKLLTSKNNMRQVFQNLISNCLKYTNAKEGIIPEINILAESFDTQWQFTISDNGIGIDPQYFEKIFIIFQRLHNKDEYSGTGIGLAITKKIVENLGGKIWVESEQGKGSTFYFTIAKHTI